MNNPFAKWKKSKQNTNDPISDLITDHVDDTSQESPSTDIADPAIGEEKVEDSFVELCRSQVRGGIERRERNDIFEAYSVFGTDTDGSLIYRYYHRYPEHEKEFSLSFSRTLSLKDFNRRLLSELDRGDIKLSEYTSCMKEAARVSESTYLFDFSAEADLSEDDASVLRAFCDEADILQNKSYLNQNGVFRCECESVIGEEKINIWFRRTIPHDSLYEDISGVEKESIEGYDIDDLWIMGVYNRLRERCEKVLVWRLTSQWSIEKESLYLFLTEGFQDISGEILAAAGNADSFRKFGFYSLDFSRK